MTLNKHEFALNSSQDIEGNLSYILGAEDYDSDLMEDLFLGYLSQNNVISDESTFLSTQYSLLSNSAKLGRALFDFRQDDGKDSLVFFVNNNVGHFSAISIHKFVNEDNVANYSVEYVDPLGIKSIPIHIVDEIIMNLGEERVFIEQSETKMQIGYNNNHCGAYCIQALKALFSGDMIVEDGVVKQNDTEIGDYVEVPSAKNEDESHSYGFYLRLNDAKELRDLILSSKSQDKMTKEAEDQYLNDFLTLNNSYSLKGLRLNDPNLDIPYPKQDIVESNIFTLKNRSLRSNSYKYPSVLGLLKTAGLAYLVSGSELFSKVGKRRLDLDPLPGTIPTHFPTPAPTVSTENPTHTIEDIGCGAESSDKIDFSKNVSSDQDLIIKRPDRPPIATPSSPSRCPTESPTDRSNSPTISSTSSPSIQPSSNPTGQSSSAPTAQSTSTPTRQSTSYPSGAPSRNTRPPSEAPTISPTLKENRNSDNSNIPFVDISLSEDEIIIVSTVFAAAILASFRKKILKCAKYCLGYNERATSYAKPETEMTEQEVDSDSSSNYFASETESKYGDILSTVGDDPIFPKSARGRRQLQEIKNNDGLHQCYNAIQSKINAAFDVVNAIKNDKIGLNSPQSAEMFGNISKMLFLAMTPASAFASGVSYGLNVKGREQRAKRYENLKNVIPSLSPALISEFSERVARYVTTHNKEIIKNLVTEVSIPSFKKECEALSCDILEVILSGKLEGKKAKEAMEYLLDNFTLEKKQKNPPASQTTQSQAAQR